MGAVNYGTSDYITMAYNCNTEYAPDDFWNDENEQRQIEIFEFAQCVYTEKENKWKNWRNTK